MANSEKAPIKIYGNDSLSTRVAAFQKKVDEPRKIKKSNPLGKIGGPKLGHIQTDKFDPQGGAAKLDKNDPRYGCPVEGSKTEKRGLAAGAHIGAEVQYLCSIITEFGIPTGDGTTSILFGELFEIYSRISNKVVGILLRARKYGLVYFEGEMLFQRRDDDVVITLLKPMSELREMWEEQRESSTQKQKVGNLVLSA